MLLYLSASSFQAGCNLWQWPHLDSNSQDEDKHNTLRGGAGGVMVYFKTCHIGDVNVGGAVKVFL